MFIRKLANNFGPGAIRALGISGYAKYFGTALGRAFDVLSARNLRPVDRAMNGVVELRHPVTKDRSVQVDLEIFRADDVAEDNFAFGLLREIWFRNVYLREFRLPNKLSGVIDLGANRGIFTLLAAAFSEHVAAVEVQDKYRLPMHQLLTQNGLHNVTLINAFVGGPGFSAPEKEQFVEFGQVVDALGGLSIDFLKMDIEGSEFGMDIGSFTDVKRMAVELHHKWGKPGDFVAKVERIGFECRTFDDSLRPVARDKADFLLAINRKFSDVCWKNAV